MKRDPYEDFARVYDDWQKLYPRPFSLALAPKVAAALTEFGVPTTVLADLACGTGTFASWWSRTHRAWTVFGSDRSAAMIRRARAAADQGLGGSVASGASGPLRADGPDRFGRGRSARTPKFLVQDLRDLSLPQPAGVLTCLFDSLNHVTRRSELGRIFRRVRAVLAPGGLFIFDLVDDRGFREVFTGSSILRGRSLYVGIETEFVRARSAGYGAARFTFFRRNARGWRSSEFRIRERRWLSGEIRALLRAAGLHCLRVTRLDAYESDEFLVPRTFWICRRPE